MAHAIKSKKARLSGRDFVQATGFTHDEDAKAPPPFTTLLGADGFKSVIEVDQSPIGKTPRSTPATYLGIFDQIRQFFATLPEAKIRGFTASRFSFNTQGGRCEACQGAGRIKLEMSFLPDTYVPCEECAGTGYARESIAVGTGTWDAASSGRGDNTSVIDFGTAGAGDWGTLTHAVFMDAASSGNAWIVVALTTPKAINNGDPVTFPAGSLGVTGA